MGVTANQQNQNRKAANREEKKPPRWREALNEGSHNHHEDGEEPAKQLGKNRHEKLGFRGRGTTLFREKEDTLSLKHVAQHGSILSCVT